MEDDHKIVCFSGVCVCVCVGGGGGGGGDAVWITVFINKGKPLPRGGRRPVRIPHRL